MVENIVVTEKGEHLVVSSPYYPSYAVQARIIGGQWKFTRKVWLFDINDKERAIELLHAVYGYGCTDNVDVQFTILPLFYSMKNIWMFGRNIATRTTRDSLVVLGKGVTVLEGGFPSSCGSRTRPTLCHYDNTVLLVRDVPRDLIRNKDVLSTISDNHLIIRMENYYV